MLYSEIPSIYASSVLILEVFEILERRSSMEEGT